MKKSALITVFLTTLLVASFSVKGQTVQRMDPPNWWIDHPLDTVEILLQGEGLLKWAAQVEKPVGKVLQTTHYGDRYSLVKLWIRSGFKEDGFNITLGPKDFFFPLLERSGHQPQGLSDQDLVYLITPDRFHNGDTTERRRARHARARRRSVRGTLRPSWRRFAGRTDGARLY